MYAQPKYELISRSELDLTAASFPAQSKKVAIPSVDPIEEILIVVQVTLGATISTYLTHGLFNILKRVGLNITPRDVGGYDCVYASGPGLMMLNDQESLGLDRCTRATLRAMNGNNTLTAGVYRFAYRISAPHPALVGQLRMRSLLDCQNHLQDPVLTLDFAAAAEISSQANPFSAANVEVFVGRREIGRAMNDAVLKDGGFLRWDVRETPYDLATSLSNVEKRFAVPSPGEYATLVMAMAAGATQPRLGDLSANVTVGQETIWSLEAGGSSRAKWRMKDLQLFNDFNRAAGPSSTLNPHAPGFALAQANGAFPGVAVVAAVAVSAENFGGPLAAGYIIQDPAVVGFDFLANAASDADDLSSLLNANFASDAIKWEIVGNVTTSATAGSNVTLIGRRYRSDVSRFKLLRAT